MCSQATTEKDQTTSVTPPISPSMPWRVQTVAALPDYRLSVCFLDGLTGNVDMTSLINSPAAGVFATLRDRALFDQVHVEHGVVTWPGGVDLAPDAMYTEIRAQGEWRPNSD